MAQCLSLELIRTIYTRVELANMPSRGVKRKNKPLTSKGEKKKFSKKKLHLPNPHKPSVNWEQLKRVRNEAHPSSP